MKKILHYIAKGRGVGALWLLAFSAIIAFYSAYYVAKVVPPLLPRFQEFTDTILPIKIENNKVVIPENTVKEYVLEYKGVPFSFVVDTTRDLLTEEEHRPGLYLTKSYVYSVMPKEIRRQPLVKEINLPKQDYIAILSEFIASLVWFIAFVCPFFNFACFFIAVLFYAFLTGFSCTINKVSLDFKTKMRLNTLLFIGVYILSILSSYLGLNLSLTAFFLLMIALQLITVKKLEGNQI